MMLSISFGQGYRSKEMAYLLVDSGQEVIAHKSGSTLIFDHSTWGLRLDLRPEVRWKGDRGTCEGLIGSRRCRRRRGSVCTLLE